MFNNEPFPSKKFQQVISEYLHGDKLETKNNRLLEEEQACSPERKAINKDMPKMRQRISFVARYIETKMLHRLLS